MERQEAECLWRWGPWHSEAAAETVCITRKDGDGAGEMKRSTVAAMEELKWRMRRHWRARFVMVVDRQDTCGQTVQVVEVSLGFQVAGRKASAREAALAERAKEKDLEGKEGLEASQAKVAKEVSGEEKEHRKAVALIVEDHIMRISVQIRILVV